MVNIVGNNLQIIIVIILRQTIINIIIHKNYI
jgi:hypothetical protein